ncbi:MAG: hypothetical protein ABIP74_04065 [Candidatus Saccharimonas sp.]
MMNIHGLRRFALSFGSLILIASSGNALLSSVASADTQPASGTPATVSADPLPTVQVDGIVWDQVLVGNKVYAVGSFTTARPAGVAKGGAGTVTRQSILAYDITTGVLDTSFVHSLTGAPDNRTGQSIAASPDGTRLYVGGSFTVADSQAHSHFAAFDLTTNKLLPGFSGTNRTVWAVAATNSRVYIGGQFSTAAGQPRASLAAYTADGNLDTAWKADVTGRTGSYVRALVVAEPYGNLIIGGTFSKINGSTYYSTGAVKLTTGKNVKWASQSSKYKIRLQAPASVSPTSTSVTSLSFDGKQAYFTAFTYIQGVSHPGTYEGRVAISPSNGTIIWADDCRGDSYDSVPIGGVLYSVGHPHNCAYIGAYPDQNNQMTPPMRALAETTARTSSKHDGLYYSKLLNWFPELNAGTVSGASQAAWSIIGNSQYIALGGEFTKANGVGQQGLVRYTIASNAPNKVGPDGFSGAGYGVVASPANSKGQSTVRIYNASDKDNSKLTYEVYRSGSSTLLASKTVDSRWWKSASWTLTDKGITPGTSLTYTVVIKDPYGNAKSVTDATLINDTDSRVKYSSSWSTLKKRSDANPDFGRDIHRTKTNGKSATLTFTGTSIALFAERGPDLGKATVSIDGGPTSEIDMNFTGTNSSKRYYQQQVFAKSGLTAGKHTIKVTKTSGKYLIIDAFKVR